jgi:hypothetical protein
MQTLSTKTGTELGYDVENHQAGAVVRRGESVRLFASWLANDVSVSTISVKLIAKSARDDVSQKRWYKYKMF